MFGTNYISLREVTRLGLRNGQGKLFTENVYLKKWTCYCKEDRLLKTLFDWPTKRKLFPDQSREQIVTGLMDQYAGNIVVPAWFLPLRSDGPAYFDMSVSSEKKGDNIFIREQLNSSEVHRTNLFSDFNGGWEEIW